MNNHPTVGKYEFGIHRKSRSTDHDKRVILTRSTSECSRRP